MEPEITLVTVTVIASWILKFRTGCHNFALSARIGMSAMLVVTGAAHFVFTKGMAMMLPKFVPFKAGLVYFTGIIELAAAVGLQIPHLRKSAARFLILFFILLTPANIYAATIHLDEQTGTLSGNGPAYLLYRIPLQVLFILWIYLSSLSPRRLAV